MTSRKRKRSTTLISDDSQKLGSSKQRNTRKKRRQNILERLEARQLLAGPQLIGIQPNEGDLIVNGSVLETAPRVLTLRFDQDQVLDSDTFEGIRLTRAGTDGLLNTEDDIEIVPGLITSGEPNENEVIIRFSETLPDDRYKLEVFGFDDDGLGIIGLRNRDGELFQPFDESQRSQTTEFDLRLGALIESIVPQPVVRLEDGSLVQNRNEIVVYFNEDPLFVEDDSAAGTIDAGGGNTIDVIGELTSRSFDDTNISFVVDNTTTQTTAVHDAEARTIVVTHPSSATVADVSDAITFDLDLFEASVVGDGTAVFDPSAGAQFTVKGNPTERSAENPRFYSLFLTQDTVRTTDDALFQPDEVAYDPITHTARLFFATDINELVPTVELNPPDPTNPDDEKTRAPVPLRGGTWRLRIGTAIDDRVDVILPPAQRPVAPSVSSDFGIDGLQVSFVSKLFGEAASGRDVRFEDTGGGGLSVALEGDGTVVFDLGGDSPTIGDLQDIVIGTIAVDNVLEVLVSFEGTGDGTDIEVPSRIVNAPALTMTAVGDTLGTALDVGTFGEDSELVSVVFQESIDPKTFLIELPGGNDDPGHQQFPELGDDLIEEIRDEYGLLQHIGDAFGADTTDGVTEIAYNFAGIFDSADGRDFLNQINERQKIRIREALGLWARQIGVQFRETASEGITFALGNLDDLQDRDNVNADTIEPVAQSELDARLRIDPTFTASAIVFSNQVDYGLDYGEDFLRKAMAGIGLILGLETTPDLPIQTLMTLDPRFLNDTINHTDPLPPFRDFLNIVPDQNSLRDLEPSFPGNFDVLHGNYLHRSDSLDVDLYKFEVDLNDANRVGTLTAETFAERLSDSSLLDTTLTLFQEQRASVVTDFGVGTTLSVRIDSFLEGRLGNNSRIDFIQTDRFDNDPTVRISQPLDSANNPIPNGLLVDIPRRSGSITEVPVGDVIDAINNDPFASSIFRVTLEKGSADADIGRSDLNFSPLLLSGGGIVQLSRNDDYFSEDSRIITQLGAGTYYIGVASTGNDRYDPTIADSGYGGRTQGTYELHLKFEPQVDKGDVIRDVDNPREDVPGSTLDGDGDGVPGGVKNFWFQTRSLNRRIDFTDDGAAVTEGQTVTIVSGTGIVRRYQFVPTGGQATPGNTAVFYSDGTTGVPTPPSGLAQALQSAVNSRFGETGVSVSLDGTSIIFTGERSVDLSSTFRGAEILGRNIFVDKTAGPQADGSLSRPFNNIANPAVPNAFATAQDGDIVRIVGNGGADGDLTTTVDNFSYQIGVADTGGTSLEDGRTMEVPRGVTTMIDAGAAFKLRNTRIGVGSSSVQLDRSNGALQVLGTPRLVQLSLPGQPVETVLIGDADVTPDQGFDDGDVIFTSSRDRAVDEQAAGINPLLPEPGNWGGLVFRRDVDQAEGRRDLEDEGIFLQHVNHADIRYGGTGNLLIDSVQQTVNPIQLINLRPTITFNKIAFSADASISAAPNSFEETSFQSPIFQVNGAFTADYSRVGPNVHRNALIDNSLNGLFVRSRTTPVSPATPVTTTVRFDDTSIVHAIAENLSVAGNPGGSISDGFSPTLAAVTGRSLSGGTLPASDYQYRMTFVDGDGFESLSTQAADAFTITVANDSSSVQLIGLPEVSQSDYVARRLYRADVSGGGTPVFKLIRELDASTPSVIDDGSELGGTLDLNATGARGRLNGSLVFDPNIVVKMQGARIELGHGAQLLAEGTKRNPVVLTSALDDRFGAGGTFDTNNDNELGTAPSDPFRGSWSGIYGSPGSNISIDNAVIAYAGGISLIGAESKGFAPIELQQANGRITNTRFEFNDDGQDGSADTGREGRLGITPATIFVRGSQPIIVGNSFIDNRGAVIGIDHDSFISDYIQDSGRQTGSSDRLSQLDDNQGPLIRNNRYQSVASFDPDERQVSGLDIRGGQITTQTVFDDTDVVHIVTDTLEVGNFHSSGGLFLKSRPEESLVVKFFGGRLQEQVHVGTAGGTANSATYGTGITATGTPDSIADRIGGTVHILGLPGAPVVLTSLKDDTVGAGLSPTGSQFNDTNGDSFGSRPEPNDWRSILLDQWSNDRNVDVTLERELSTAVAPGFNSTTENAQVLGELAKSIDEGDDTRRLGFDVTGFLSGPTDVDVYSFVGSPGTEVWVDIDQTLFQLDTVIEILDVSGNVLGRSDNSFAEIAGTESVLNFDPESGNVGTLQRQSDEYTDFGVGGLYEDFNSTNPRDAGLRFTLPGTQSNLDSRSVYFFRVRSASVNPDDVAGGLTGGGYRFQVRLAEDQEFPGSVVRFADIRYANNGIHVRGLPGESPLLGDAQENEGVADPPTLNGVTPLAGVPLNDRIVTSTRNFSIISPTDPAPGQRPQYLGNLVENKKNVISVGGRLETVEDIDFYQIDLEFGEVAELYQSTVFDVDYADGSRPDTNISIFWDPDGEFGIQAPRLVLFGENANISEDRPSPLGQDSDIEALLRGSIGEGDSFVGPVSLPEGTYYVGISESGSIPTELVVNPFVRREPINSVQRIFEDRVNPAEPSTASGPRFDELFTNGDIAGSGFSVTTQRSEELGHGLPAAFDFSTATEQPPKIIYEEGTDPLPFDIGSNTFTALDLDDLDWSVADQSEIGGAFVNGLSENTSTFIPHVTVDATLQADVGDVYQFIVPQDGTRVIIDIDHGDHPFFLDPNAIDIEFELYNLALDPPALVASSDDANVNDGRVGSAPDIPLTSSDPFFDGVLGAGFYNLAIAQSPATVTLDTVLGTIDITNAATPPGVVGTYRLHVSMEDHELPDRPDGNQSLFFDRNALAGGTLTSQPFDLLGYSPDDQPRFYFNYNFDAPRPIFPAFPPVPFPFIEDAVTYTVTSFENPDGVEFTDLVGDGQWRQSIVPLNDFAGHTDIQVSFTYDRGNYPATIPAFYDGLFLDDFIVGFAERGETVFSARGDQDQFFVSDEGNTGEYQLEVRTATNFATPTGGAGDLPSSQRLDRDFDTNDRHAQQITIIAPAGNQIQDGDTFVISDGATTQRFEFDSNNQSSFANVPISFDPINDTSVDIAERLRAVINIAAQLDIEAASSAGLDTEDMQDNRLDLFGAVDGTFESIGSPDELPTVLTTNAAGDLLMPAILHNGLGDSNYQRVQSQIIVENNVISDANAIGIWSDPGDRDVDPEDLREDPRNWPNLDPFEKQPVDVPHPLLQQIPVGNVYPGAVRNLPTLNDEVIGGLAPGVVIRNNTVDQAGLAGIKVSGETRPFVLDGFDGFAVPEVPLPPLCDGLSMAVDAGGTRVVFEFEDIGGAATAICGSGVLGGDGFTDGHVPIYYGHRNSAIPYTSQELALAIQSSIQGSPLVSNDMAELVTAYVGPSLNSRNEYIERFAAPPPPPTAFSTAAVYLDGVSNIYYTNAFAKGAGFTPFVSLAPVGEAVQPVARITNNTVYGADGIESQFPGDPTVETNDLIDEAVITHVGRAHTGAFLATAEIGDIDEEGFISLENDVDFYQVELVVGDRLIVDIDTVADGPDTTVRLFDSSGIAQIVTSVGGSTSTINTSGVAPGHLDPAGANDVNNGIDPFVDFTALETGTYYVAVSGAGNDDYDPNDLSGRVNGAGGTGQYDIGLEVYSPRQVVLSINGGRGTTGTTGDQLIGTTFTVTQIPDVVYDPNSPYSAVNSTGNQITFEFSAAGGLVLGNGNINIPLTPIPAAYTVPDIMRAISNSVNGFQNVAEAIDFPAIPNFELGEDGIEDNGPSGVFGPIHRGRAIALGGDEGDNQGLNRLLNPSPFSGGLYDSELYVLFQNVAEIEVTGGLLTLTPDDAKPQFAQNSDQLVAEAGIWVTSGASPTILNNVVSNAHQSILVEESNELGFGKRVEVFGDQFVKQQEVFLTGSVFQHDEERNNEIRSDGHWTIETSLSTDEVVGATNVADESDDFNFTLGDNDPLFVNAAGNDFLPNGSVLIDSAINAVDERDSLLTVKDSIGLPTSNVVSPNRDVRGVLRQDNPNFATPGALGFSVFKDRGSNELADFVGPFATTEVPQDNDAEGIDLDPSTGFINLSGGILEEFRIQLRDTGDESDPFAGFGVDDRTVVVPEIPGLRPTGANLTLFEDDRLLTEGVDYTFNYDETKNVITLTPLAGIWKNDRAYRIALNNQDRTVLVAPDPSLVTDGDQVTITDSAGGTLVFEFEIGYSLLLPEPITMVIPRVGTNAGGVSDGDIFQIDDGENPIIVFELDNNNVTLPNTVVVPLPPGQTPSVEEDLREFLDQIAQNLGDAIQSQVDAGNLNASVRVLRTQSIPGGRITPEVVVGTESGSTLNTTISGLQQKPRTLAFRVPDAGTGVGGIEDGDSFIVDNGVAAATFEFDDGSGLNNNTNIVVPITPGLSGPEVAQIIADTISEAGLSLNPLVEANGEVVYLNLPLDGEARIISGQMDLVGVSRTPVDGDTVIITPNDGSPDLTFEINRTDEPSPDGPMDDGVNAPNIEIPITRSTTADELAGRIENAIQSSGEIAGLSPNDLQVIDGGILSVGGEEGLGLAVTGSTLEVTGSPSVTGASTIEILGPLLLTLSPVGGSAISPGSVLVLTDDAGEDQIFEFLTPGFPSSGFNVVPYNTFDTADVIATNLVTAINAANIGIPASLTGSLGEISLGRIDDSRVNTNGIFLPGPPPAFLPGLDSATVRRGIVSDGEILTIRQGPTTVGFEFEAAIGGGGVQPNNVAVPFELGSTVGDVAVALAAAINNNRGNLQVSAVAELDLNGDPTGNVLLNDQPGTEINVTRAPTLSVTGVPGGATPIRISPDFGPVEVKQALILAINSVNQPDRPAATTLLAEDRGGATFFVKNGVIFSGLIENFALPAITDFAGNPLEANRPDLSTQFTILMPTVGLDFGDAPDPRDEVPGRYPTTNANNGPRHVVGNDLSLGFFTDADTDGIPGVAANGDDRVIEISESVGLFNTSLVEDVPIQIDLDDQTFETMADLAAQIVVDLSVDPMTRDGDLITIQTGTSSATLEFDVNFRFDENHFAIRPEDPTSADSIAEAIGRAIAESPLTPASVSVDGDTVLINADDEDGVTFLSETNPTGVLNRGISTPIEVSVTGAGVLEAWIDFNADGDWNDPGEQIIPMPDNDTFDDLRSEICPTNLTGIASNIFAATGGASTRQFCIVVPPTTPEPQAPVTTYARFRISREGGLGPDGLALSGEVEDYALTLLPGLPPQIANPFLTYTVAEDEVLDAFDAFGTLNATTDDDGLLATVVDPDGDPVEIFADDVGQSELFVDGIKAGDLTVFDDGTFTFDSVNNFNGIVNFSVRVTDVQPLDPSTELVNSRPISVTINVTPVNDAPFATQTPVVIESDVLEDQDPSPTFGINELGALYLPGPTDEVDSGQTLILDSVFDENGNQLQTTMGGQLELSDDLTSVTYTPPADYFGPDTFFYVIADDLGVPTELPEEIGTVSLTVLPVNDAPRPENDADSIAAGVESITLLLRDNGNGLLDNDLPGPANEVGDPLFDTVELDLTNPFDDSNSAGNVELLLDGNNQVIGFTYERPELIDGADTFTYQVVDNFGATATGTVTIDVAGQNDPPVFNGTFVDTSGVVYTDSRIDLTESSDVNVISFDLSQSFTDPEGDALIFDAIVDPDTNDSGMTAEVNGNILTLTIPAFGFDGEGPGEGGGVLLTVTADDATNDAVSVDAAVFIAKVEDPPVVIDPANPVVLLGDEDIDVVKDLTEVFRDDDGDVLTYTLLSIDNIPVGDPTNIDHPLIESVQFVDDADNPTGPGDELLITLNDDQSGSAQFRISATDPTNRTSGPALFLLDISPVADAPVGVADEREAPIGSRVQELDPANGLLANDSDADGDGISVIPITDEVGDFGTLTVNADGTFVYTVATPEFPSAPGEPPKVDTFQYQIVDDSPDALVSDPIDLRFELTPSRYQNPMVTVIDGEPVQLRWDVTGDGFVTPIDALRIINFIDRRGTNIPVSEIGAPPPDFLDVNGNGQVEVLDALQVINRLDRDSQADGEMLGNAEGEFLAPVAAAVSSGYASGSMVNLPSRNMELVTDSPSADETLDSVLAGGLEISSSANTSSMDWVDDDDESASNDEVDAALSALLGDEDLTGDDV